MFSLTNKIVILIISTPLTWGYCLLLKNQECKVRKVIIDNGYVTFPYKSGVDVLDVLKLDVLEVVMIKIILISKFVYQIVLKILV